MSLPDRGFWFLRHGETDWNARGLSQGRADIPLNPTGIAQAERAARALAGRGIGHIVCSPLERAAHTARIVGGALSLPVEFDPDLQETDFGVQEGQPMGEWYEDWIAGRFTPEGGESFAALRARALAALRRAVARRGLVLVVAHGALWRSFRQAAGLPPNIRTPNALPLFAEPGTPWRLLPAELP